MNQKKVNRIFLIKNVASRLDMDDATVKKVVDAFVEEMATSLCNGETITLRNLGTLRIFKASSRQRVDFRNMGKIIIPEHLSVKFIPSERVKESLWKSIL